MHLPPHHFATKTAVELAQELIGCELHSQLGGVHTAGIITETEAYHEDERGCHAYGGKRTKRTEIMFAEGGVAYIYLCYGMHHLFNVVCAQKGRAEAVLIRAIEPIIGTKLMLKRRNQKKVGKKLTAGPARLSQALGITTDLNKISLKPPQIWIEERKTDYIQIDKSPRIGIDYAENDALLPYRFTLRDSIWIT